MYSNHDLWFFAGNFTSDTHSFEAKRSANNFCITFCPWMQSTSRVSLTHLSPPKCSTKSWSSPESIDLHPRQFGSWSPGPWGTPRSSICPSIACSLPLTLVFWITFLKTNTEQQISVLAQKFGNTFDASNRTQTASEILESNKVVFGLCKFGTNWFLNQNNPGCDVADNGPKQHHRTNLPIQLLSLVRSRRGWWGSGAAPRRRSASPWIPHFWRRWPSDSAFLFNPLRGTHQSSGEPHLRNIYGWQQFSLAKSSISLTLLNPKFGTPKTISLSYSKPRCWWKQSENQRTPPPTWGRRQRANEAFPRGSKLRWKRRPIDAVTLRRKWTRFGAGTRLFSRPEGGTLQFISKTVSMGLCG